MPRIEFVGVSKIYRDGTPAVTDLDLAIEDGEFFCLLGPSGCGKSSTLRMLAGLETVSRGDIVVNGRRITGTPPQQRDMAMVFENYALYPHLDVFGNLAMPLHAQRRPRAEVERRVAEVAELLQITEHLRKRPRQLSGGQRQRVGLGRAIIRTPGVFLMDEPLGHLEAYLRVQLRSEVQRLHERLGTTTFYITHDQEEAAAVSDRIAVMRDGRLQQIGTLPELLDRPINRFVAEFIGRLPINLCPARLVEAGGDLAVAVGDARLPLAAEQAARLHAQTAAGSGGDGVVAFSPLEFGIRPSDVRLVPTAATDTLGGVVALLEPQGDTTVVIADTPAGRIGCVVASGAAPAVDGPVHLGFDMAHAHLFVADGGANLLHPA